MEDAPVPSGRQAVRQLQQSFPDFKPQNLKQKFQELQQMRDTYQKQLQDRIFELLIQYIEDESLSGADFAKIPDEISVTIFKSGLIRVYDGCDNERYEIVIDLPLPYFLDRASSHLFKIDLEPFKKFLKAQRFYTDVRGNDLFISFQK